MTSGICAYIPFRVGPFGGYFAAIAGRIGRQFASEQP